MDLIDRALQVFPVGANNAVQSSSIQYALGCSSGKQVRNIVSSFRKAGIPICSSSCGYYLPETREEAIRCAERLIAHGAEEIRVARAINASVADLYGQTSIYFKEGIDNAE